MRQIGAEVIIYFQYFVFCSLAEITKKYGSYQQAGASVPANILVYLNNFGLLEGNDNNSLISLSIYVLPHAVKLIKWFYDENEPTYELT